jgi:hypothetical protein
MLQTYWTTQVACITLSCCSTVLWMKWPAYSLLYQYLSQLPCHLHRLRRRRLRLPRRGGCNDDLTGTYTYYRSREKSWLHGANVDSANKHTETVGTKVRRTVSTLVTRASLTIRSRPSTVIIINELNTWSYKSCISSATFAPHTRRERVDLINIELTGLPSSIN